MQRLTLTVFVLTTAIAGLNSVSAQDTLTVEPDVNATTEENERIVDWFYDSHLQQAEKQAAAAVRTNAEDSEAAYALGMLKFLRAVERFGQRQYRFGLQPPNLIVVPFIRIPVPKNPSPDEISYEDARRTISQFVADLSAAETALAKVSGTDAKLRLNVRRISFDFDQDGKKSKNEHLWDVFAAVNRGAARNVPGNPFVAFDAGDVDWLRGYCNLLQALGNVALAHDWRELHERIGHLIYPRVKGPFTIDTAREEDRTFSSGRIADLIATIHLMRFEVREPDRMRVALRHLEEMIRLSRESWKHILAETDNDREWLPNPKQTAALTSVRIRPNMVDAWHTFLDEAEALLQGRKLAPFWRPLPNEREKVAGINVRKIFTEPRLLDPVLFVQGSDAMHYLEEGELTDPNVWRQLTGAFGGRFWGFAMWIN